MEVHPGHFDGLRRQPAESAAAEVRTGQGAQQIARLRAGQHQHPVVVGDVGRRRHFPAASVLAQEVEVAQLGDRRREQVETVLVHPGHGELALDPARFGQVMSQDDAAVLPGHAVGQQAVQKGLGVGARDLELGEAREVEDPDPLAHGPAFLGDVGEGRGPAEAVLLLRSIGREPLRPLPAEDLGIDRAPVLELAVERRRADRPARIAELARIVDLVHLLVLVDRLLQGVVAERPVAVAPGVEAIHVDVGLAVHHPLGEILAGARSLGDTDRGAAAHPVVLHARRRAEQEAAVRQVGDRAVDDPLDARGLEAGQPVHGVFQAGRDLVQVGRQELHVEAPVDAVEAPGLGVLHLVGPDQDALLLLPVVGRGDGVADHRRLLVERLHLGQVLGHQVLVAHVDDRHPVVDPGRDLVAEGAGRVDHVLAGDRALLGNHLPFAARALLGVEHPVAQHDLGAAHARTLGHGVGRAGRVGVAVVGRVGARQDALDVQQRMQVLDLVGADDVHLDAEVGELALDVAEPVDLVGLGRQADRAAAVPAGRLPGLRLEGLVELHPVGVDRGHGEPANEVGNQAGRVPGRARSELTLVDQHDVGPAFLGQMVEQAGTHGAAADHHHAGMALHGICPLSWVTSGRCRAASPRAAA